MEKTAAQNKKRILAVCLIAAALLLAVAVELCYVALKNNRIDKGNYEKLDVASAQFELFELDDLGGSQYYALANDSYLYIGELGGISAQAIELRLEPQAGDATQRLLFFSGKKDGVRGEFMVPLAQSADSVFSAEADFQEINSIMIFPTEQVRSTFGFYGMTINPYVARESFSAARMALFALVLLALLAIAALVVERRKKRPTQRVWLRAAIIAMALGGLLGFSASGMFTIGRTAGHLLIVAGAGAAGMGTLLVWLFANKIKTVHNRVFAAALLVGAVFCFASAPLQAPDEQNHFLRAYALSEGVLDFSYDYEFPGDVSRLIDSFPAEYNNKLEDGRVPPIPQRLAEYMRAASEPHEGELAYHSTIQVNLPYVPAAFGILLTRLCGLNALFALWAARLMNVVVYAFCARFAMKRAARYEISLMAALLLPITLFMVASASYDAMFLSALAVFLGAVLAKRETRGILVAMVAAFAVMIYIKPVYLPLCLLVFLIPKQDVGVKPKRGAQLGLLALAGLAMWGASLLYSGAVNSGIPAGEGLRWVDQAAQIKYVLLNPLRYLTVVLVDGFDHAFYLGEGGLFGALDVNARLTGILVPVVVAGVSLLAAGQAKKQKKRDTWLLLGLGLFMYILLVTSFYVVWSTLGSTSVLGVQARYFIPVTFLLSAALASLAARRAKPLFEPAFALNISFAACALLALLGAAELFAAYFV